MTDTLSERLRAIGFGGDADPSWGVTANLLNEVAAVVDRALEVITTLGNGMPNEPLTLDEMKALAVLEDQLRNGVRILPPQPKAD